jgi:hypothetical protein
MKKFTLTLFLALATLSSFAQSTVKTIRVATATTLFTANLPTGTVVIDLATSNVYTATAGISLTGNSGAAFNITDALAEAIPLLKKINGSVFSVTQEADVAATAAALEVTLASAVFNSATATVADFKVYLNGTLLKSSAFVYDHATTKITLTAAIYEFDVVSVTYSSFQ